MLSHRRRKPFLEILLRHRQRLLGCLRLWSMELLVIVAVERDTVLGDVHEEISPVGEAVVHLLQRMHDEIHRRVQIGRASGRERVCQYVSISVVAGSLKKKKKKKKEEG